MSTVAVKNIDEKVYRKVKALASLSGKTVGEAVNEALFVWTQLASKGVQIDKWIELEDNSRKDNEAYEKQKQELLSQHKGEYVAITNGKILGTYGMAKEAYRAISDVKAKKHGIVTRLGEENETTQVVDLGWSIMEQLAQ